MAILPWQIFITGCLMMSLFPSSSGVSVDLQVPDGPVNEGEMITIQCTVTAKSQYQISITRHEEGTPNDEFLVIRDGHAPLLPDNIAFEKSVAGDNMDTFVFSLTINVVRQDAQIYTCSATSPTLPTLPEISDNGQLVVYYLPGIMYPLCEIDGSDTDLMRQAEDKVVLDCTTEIGNPPVDLKWTRTFGTNDVLVPSINIDGTLHTARIIVTLKTQDDGAMFTCSFAKDPARSCSIGPFQVSGSNSEILSPSGFDSGMAVAIAILVVVIIIVIIVVVIALLIKSGCCSCDNCKNRNSSYSEPMEMKVSGKKAGKRTNKTDQSLKYEMAAPIPIPAELYSEEPQKDIKIPNISSAPKEKLYPPPPTYPSQEGLDVLPDDEDAVDFAQDVSISSSSSSSSDSPVPPMEEEKPVEPDSTEFVATVTIE